MMRRYSLRCTTLGLGMQRRVVWGVVRGEGDEVGVHSNGGRVEQGCVEQGPMEIPLAYDLIPAEDRGRRVLPIIVSFSFPSPHLDVTIHDLTISFYFIPSYTPLSLFSAVIIRRTTPWTYAFFRAFFLAPSPCIPLPHQYIYIYIYHGGTCTSFPHVLQSY